MPKWMSSTRESHLVSSSAIRGSNTDVNANGVILSVLCRSNIHSVASERLRVLGVLVQGGSYGLSSAGRR